MEPDWESSAQMMDQEYLDLEQQEYVLVRYGNLRVDEIASMTAERRQRWIKRMNDDAEKERKATSKASGKGQAPGFKTAS